MERTAFPHPDPPRASLRGENCQNESSRVESLNRRGGRGTGGSPVRFETHGRDALATTLLASGTILIPMKVNFYCCLPAGNFA